MGRGCNPEKSAVVPLVGWGVISLKKCRYWGAALPPDDGTPPAPSVPPRGMCIDPAEEAPMFGGGPAAR